MKAEFTKVRIDMNMCMRMLRTKDYCVGRCCMQKK